MSEIIALKSCKGCIHVWVCRYRNSLGGTKCNNKKLVKDVRDVVIGKWQNVEGFEKDDPRVKCSICGSIETPIARHNFCPNCGADMRGE